MVNVHSKRCVHHGCAKQPSDSVSGTKTKDVCVGHGKDGMVNVRSKRRAHRLHRAALLWCGRYFGAMLSTRRGRVCQGSQQECAQPGCTKVPRYGATGSLRALCARHATDGVGRFNTPKNLPGVHGRSGGTGAYGAVAVDGGTAGTRTGRSSSSVQTRESTGRCSKGDREVYSTHL